MTFLTIVIKIQLYLDLYDVTISPEPNDSKIIEKSNAFYQGEKVEETIVPEQFQSATSGRNIFTPPPQSRNKLIINRVQSPSNLGEMSPTNDEKKRRNINSLTKKQRKPISKHEVRFFIYLIFYVMIYRVLQIRVKEERSCMSYSKGLMQVVLKRLM